MIVLNALIWAFWFSIFVVIIICVSLLQLKRLINKTIDIELKRLNELNKIKKEIDEYSNTLKLTVTEKKIERLKEIYKNKEK